MKKIVSLNVSDTNVYDKSSLEVRITALCRYCVKMSLMVALHNLGVLLYFPVDGVLVHLEKTRCDF